jgi:hypothetical protein
MIAPCAIISTSPPYRTCLYRPNVIGEFGGRSSPISGERSHFFVETTGTVPCAAGCETPAALC